MQAPSFDWKNLLKRPEVLTLILAVLVSALAASGLVERAGLPIPEAGLGKLVAIFWAVFIGYVFENKYRKVDYAGGLKQLLGSLKFRLALIAMLGMTINAVAQPFGFALPDETVNEIAQFIVYAILGKGGLDGIKNAWGKL